MSGFVVWFTGLSGSGKSTLAAMLSAELRARGVHVELLDGDEVRTHLSKGLGFSREDRDTNVRRIGFVAKLIARSGGCAMTAAISPYRAIRDEIRAQIPRFVEVYCACAVPVLADRDPKGLYRKALAGEIKNFTGIDDPYEAPESPEVLVQTDQETKEESLARIVARLEELGCIPRHGAVAGAPARRAAAPALVAPHGGELVDRAARGRDAEALAERAKALPVVDLDERAERDVDGLAVGVLSPLTGFMTSKDYLRVVREMRLERGLPWTVPITLAVSEAQAGALRGAPEAALRARDGRLVAILEISDVWRPDRELEAREVHGTTDPEHPAVARLLSAGPFRVGGEIRALARAAAAPLPAYDRSPAEVRAHLAAAGWRRVVGFSAARPMLRAHEHITKAALEACDGLLIHAPLDPAPPEDVPVEVRVRCCEALLARYYPRDRALLSVYPGAMRHAGAREVLFDAIVLKNHGCSQVIVARDDLGDVAAAAHDLASTFGAGELGVAPLFFDRAFYSTGAGSMATVRTAPEGAPSPGAPTVGEVLARLRRGEAPPPELVRPEVARILAEAR